jgi:hypothetical protein
VQLRSRPACFRLHASSTEMGGLRLLGVALRRQPQLLGPLSSACSVSWKLCAQRFDLCDLAQRVVACAHTTLSVLRGDELRLQRHGCVATHRPAAILEQLLLVFCAAWSSYFQLRLLPSVDDGLAEFVPVGFWLVVCRPLPTSSR